MPDLSGVRKALCHRLQHESTSRTRGNPVSYIHNDRYSKSKAVFVMAVARVLRGAPCADSDISSRRCSSRGCGAPEGRRGMLSTQIDGR